MNSQHKHELWALWSLALAVIGGSIYVARLAGIGTGDSQTHGIVIGGLMAVLPMLVNAIRNIGQAQAMQTMAEQLGQSAPAPQPPPGPLDLAGAELPSEEK